MKPKLISILGISFLLLAPVILRAQGDDEPRTGQPPARQYAQRIVNSGALARSGAAAGLDQALTNPYGAAAWSASPDDSATPSERTQSDLPSILQ